MLTLTDLAMGKGLRLAEIAVSSFNLIRIDRPRPRQGRRVGCVCFNGSMLDMYYAIASGKPFPPLFPSVGLNPVTDRISPSNQNCSKLLDIQVARTARLRALYPQATSRVSLYLSRICIPRIPTPLQGRARQ